MPMAAGSPTNVQFPISVDITGAGTVVAGMKIKAYNRNNKEEITADIEADDAGVGTFTSVLDGGNFVTRLSNDDVIEVRLEGAGLTYGVTTKTITLADGGAKVSLTATDINTSLNSISI